MNEKILVTWRDENKETLWQWHREPESMKFMLRVTIWFQLTHITQDIEYKEN